jgi:hypothetical protein
MSDGWDARGHTVFVIYYESPYVVYPPEGHMYIHGSLFYQDAAAKLAVKKAISQA